MGHLSASSRMLMGKGVERKPCSQHRGLPLTERQSQLLLFSGGEGQRGVRFACWPCAGGGDRYCLMSQSDSGRKPGEWTILTCAPLKKRRSFQKAAGWDGMRQSKTGAGMMGLLPEMGSLWEWVVIEVSAHSDLRIHSPSPGKKVWFELSGKPII